MPANREWLEFQFGNDTPPPGICDECAAERNACLRCGRVPGLAETGNARLETWALQDEDERRLEDAGLGDLAGLCEPCLVRDYLMDDRPSEAALSKKTAFGLAVIIARHWAGALHLGQQGLPAPDIEQVEQLAAIICTTLIKRPETLTHVVANEARDPTFRRALGMLAETYIAQENAMPPLLKEWVGLRDAGRLSKQRVNRPVKQHQTLLITLIICWIGNLPWVSESGLTATRNRVPTCPRDPDSDGGNEPVKGYSVCDAVHEGLKKNCPQLTYYALEQIYGRELVRMGV